MARSAVISIDAAAPLLRLSYGAAAPGGVVTVEWLRVRGGDPFAWVALFPVGGSTATRASPAPTIGASVDGSVALAVPGSVTPGSYELRLFAVGRTVRISAPLEVTGGNARVVTGPVGDSRPVPDGLVTWESSLGRASLRVAPQTLAGLPDGVRLRVLVELAPRGLNSAEAGSLGGGATVPLGGPQEIRLQAESMASGEVVALPDSVRAAAFEVRLPRLNAAEGLWLLEVQENGQFLGYIRAPSLFDAAADQVVMQLSGWQLQGTLVLPVALQEAFVRNFDARARIFSSPFADAVDLGEAAPQFTAMRVLSPQVGERIFVFNTFTGQVGWIDAKSVGPSGAP